MFGQKNGEVFAPTHIPANPTQAETVIGPSVKVDGQFKGEGNIIIKGEVKGSVKTKQHLEVGDKAVVKANIEAESAEIAGQVIGNLKIKSSLKVNASAHILGDIFAKEIEVSAGARIQGQINMELEGDKVESKPISVNEEDLPSILKKKGRVASRATKKKEKEKLDK